LNLVRPTIVQSKSNQFLSNPNDYTSVDLEKVYQEVLRRASKYDNLTFVYDKETLKKLISEDNIITKETARAAVIALEGQMRGWYSDLERANYGKGVLGPDFKAKGKGKYSNIRFVEVKGLVDKEVGSLTPYKQGKNVAQNINFQRTFWPDHERVKKKAEEENWNTVIFYENLPTASEEILTVVDLFEISDPEQKDQARLVILDKLEKKENIEFLNAE